MTDKLAPETAAGPTTDALTEQQASDRPVDVKLPEEEPKAEKPEAKKLNETARSDAVKKAMEKALSEEKPADAKPEAKPEAKAEKPQKRDEEPAAADDGAADKPATGRDGDDARPSEGRKSAEPPARFLPEAREKWQAVPREVKAEIHRVSQEYEAQIREASEARERYEPLRQYDDMARSNGRDLKQSLEKVVEIETALARNPIAGLDMILREVGPRKPDGTPMSLMDVAQFVARQSPEQMQAIMGQGKPQQQQPDPRMDQLTQQIQQLETQIASQALVPMMDRFIADHPDYHDLEGHIAAVLRKGVIDELYGTGLSPEQKLSAAYRMVGGRIAPSHVDPDAAPVNSQPAPARQANPAGRKSVSGSPNGEQKATPRKLDRKAAIEKAMRQAGL